MFKYSLISCTKIVRKPFFEIFKTLLKNTHKIKALTGFLIGLEAIKIIFKELRNGDLESTFIFNLEHQRLTILTYVS